MNFDLWKDAWIPVVTTAGASAVLSLEAALDGAGRVADIALSPVPRMAVIRLMLAVASSPYPVREMPLFGDRAFLQCPGLPYEPRTPAAILEMADDANAALSPSTDAHPCRPATIALALVTSWFCDRPGFKTRVPGVSISGSRPLFMGMVSAMPCGDTIADLISMNRLAGGDWVPWWMRPVDFDEPFSGDPVHQLLWPWRRLSASAAGITIVAGSKLSGVDDPWVIGRASVKTVMDLGDMAPDARCDITAIALSQATPVIIRQWTHKPKKNAET